MLLRTALHTSTTQPFMSAVARYQNFKSPNQSFAVTRVYFLPGVLLILSNLATMSTRSLLIAEAPLTMI